MSQLKSQPSKRILFVGSPNLAVVRKRFDASGAESPDGANERITLTGLAIPWNVLSSDRGGFVVRLLPGSAKFTTPTHALFHHDYRGVLGSTENKTLSLNGGDFGVNVEIALPNTQTAADVAELVEKKYINGMSFSMLMDDALQAEEKTEGDQTILEVANFNCSEVTVTAIPSFADTSIGVKANDQSIVLPSQMSKAPERIAQALKLEQLKLATFRL